MKKIIFLANLVLCAMFVNAQTTQTKTLDLGDDVSVTYSYYLNDKGEEVYHGKMTVTEAPTNNHARKGKKTVTCNYQNGKLTGTFTYSCNMQHFEKYIDKSKGVDYNVSTGNYEVSTMWKKVRDQKENFTVDLYENYLNGDFNISASARYADYQLLTVTGKAQKGILVDGATCELKQDGEVKESYTNTAPNFNDAKYVDYKAGQNYGAGQYMYNAEGIVIEFGYTAPLCSFTLKYPKYTKPYIKLSDIDSWQKYQSGRCTNILDSIFSLESIRDGAAPSNKNDKVRYDLLQEDIDLVSKLVDSLKIVAAQQEQNAKQQRDNRVKEYTELYSKIKKCYNECNGANYEKFKALYGQIECPLYIIKDGKYIPLMLDPNIENLVCNEINKQRNYILSNGTKINLQQYNHYSKDYSNNEYISDQTDVKQYELDALKNYLKRVSPEKIDTLIQLRKNAPSIIAKCKEVALLYTKTSSSASAYRNYSRTNCTSKVTKKPVIYNAYTEVTAYLYEEQGMSLSDLSDANLYIDMLNDFMIQYASEKTKDLEKALTEAKNPEEKLFILLKQ